jgi:dTDP-glucose pyrophosphorylase
MLKNDITKFIIFDDKNINQAIMQLNNVNPPILFVIDKHKNYIGTITDGDIRRFILTKKSLTNKIANIVNKKSVICKFTDLSEKKFFFEKNIIDKNLKGIPIIKSKKLYGALFSIKKKPIETPVLIMAGGKGRRLLPLTLNIPKPLIKIDSKPMLQHLIESIKIENFKSIFISINHLGSQIKKFTNSVNFVDLDIKFIEETKPLGTAGPLYLIKDKVLNNLIVINADIMTDLKLEKILNFHNDMKSDLTIGCLIYEYQIPFGVVSLKKNKFNSIEEKPLIKRLVNCGIYVLNKNIIKLIKKKENISMIDLIDTVNKKEKKISLFPMYENWIDVGNKVNLQKARNWLNEK